MVQVVAERPILVGMRLTMAKKMDNKETIFMVICLLFYNDFFETGGRTINAKCIKNQGRWVCFKGR